MAELVLDPRHLSRPVVFDGAEEGRYPEWRFQVIAYLGAIDHQFPEIIDQVDSRTTPYTKEDMPVSNTPENTNLRKGYVLPYSILVRSSAAAHNEHGAWQQGRTRGTETA